MIILTLLDNSQIIINTADINFIINVSGNNTIIYRNGFSQIVVQESLVDIYNTCGPQFYLQLSEYQSYPTKNYLIPFKNINKIEKNFDQTNVYFNNGTLKLVTNESFNDISNQITNLNVTKTDINNLQAQINFNDLKGFKYIYPSSYWVDFTDTINTTVTVQNFLQDILEGGIFYIRKQVIIDRLRINITIAAATGNGLAGIYKFDNNTWNKVAQINTAIDITLLGVQELLFPTNITLDEGIYSFCVNFSNAVTLEAQDAYGVMPIFGRLDTMTSVSFLNYVSLANAYTGDLPPTPSLVIGNNNTFPSIIYKIV